jgi:hypothetical protein
MFVLAMATFRANSIPSIRFNSFDNIADLHIFSASDLSNAPLEAINRIKILLIIGIVRPASLIKHTKNEVGQTSRCAKEARWDSVEQSAIPYPDRIEF